MLYFSLVPGSEWCRKSSELGVPDMWTGKKLIDLQLRNCKSDLKEKEMTDCSFYDPQLKRRSKNMASEGRAFSLHIHGQARIYSKISQELLTAL